MADVLKYPKEGVAYKLGVTKDFLNLETQLSKIALLAADIFAGGFYTQAITESDVICAEAAYPGYQRISTLAFSSVSLDVARAKIVGQSCVFTSTGDSPGTMIYGWAWMRGNIAASPFWPTIICKLETPVDFSLSGSNITVIPVWKLFDIGA